ncbi:SusC/RagA family TonB-linked outer membrane protein, partial [Parabacteroides goldsteinii]
MKITTLFSLAVACCISASTYAQDYKVSIKKNNASIIEILKEIEKNSEFTFFFNDNHVNVNKKVSVNAKNVTLDEVLTQIFNNTGYNYQIIDRQVLIKAFTEPNQATNAAQQKTKIVSGVINDETGLPVIGANVVEKGTTNGTITDAEGRFSLNVASDATLVITYIGYVTSEIPVIGKNSVTITLREDTEVLDEVIVVGYGTMKKKDLTGSVAAIKGDDLAARKTTQLSTALQGAIAGVTVTRDNNAPGAAAGSIRVRGITTIGDTSPLVIIDGVPGSINDVNPNDVESMSVLKDAASSSIYGSRAAAGVILITTKRAQEKSLSIDYNFEYGLEIPTKQPKYVGVKRFLETTNELRYNDNKSGGWNQAYSDDDINNWEKYHQTNPDKYPMTDWVGMILKGSAPRQTHTIGVAGGSKAVKSSASFVYDKVDGLYADRFYERYMIRSNNDFTVNKYLGATLDFNFKRTKNHQPYYTPFYNIRLAPMIYPAVWANGEYANGKNGNNPYALVNSSGFKDEWFNKIGGRAAINITPFDGLKISGVIAPNYTFAKNKDFYKAVSYSLEDDPNIIGGYMEGYSSTKLSEARNDSYDVTIQAIANYMKTFGKHDLNVMAGYETYRYFGENLGASRDQYELDNFPYLDIGPLDLRDNYGSAVQLAYQSWFGRVAYNYNNRYLLQANVRYDGSSRFHSDYRWGIFPSFSAGWVMSEEAFMKNADIKWLSFLKLRASYGTLGNERISDNYY